MDLDLDLDLSSIPGLESLAGLKLDQMDAEKYFNAPPPPATVLEALEQRLAKYEQTMQEAMASNDKLKVNRYKRIVQKYQQAIKNHKAGKLVDYEGLPTPPGFAEIPIGTKSSPAPAPTPVPKPAPAPAPKPAPASAPKPAPAPVPKPAPAPAPKPINEPSGRPSAVKASVSRPIDSGQPNIAPKPKANTSAEVKQVPSSSDEQMNYFLERQHLFKSAALESKREGNIQQALEYLRLAKGFDPLIEATRSGLPIDTSSIPTPPQIKDGYRVKHTSPVKSSAPKANSSSSNQGKVPEPRKQINAVRSKVSPKPEVTPKPKPPTPPRAALKKQGSIKSEKQLNYLTERQKLFKQAALDSKRKGDTQQALEYLRLAKGFDPLIEATKNGMPIDSSAVPIPPQFKEAAKNSRKST